MTVKFVGKRKTYYFVVPSEDWENWRTNDGHTWECLMGMSWEDIDPPEELQKFWDKHFED